MTARSPSGRLLFRDTHDRRVYLRLLAEEASRAGWAVLSYCQMTNHVHLLVQTPITNLGVGIKATHAAFAGFVNNKYAEHGHVFGQRFSNKLVHEDAHLFGSFRYIAWNPVKAGLCRAPVDWPWSAHAALAGSAPPQGPLAVEPALSFFGDDLARARAEYVRLTAADDEELLATLQKRHPDSWVKFAVADFGISVASIASALGVTTRTIYRRLAACR